MPENREELVKYRLESAKERLKSAKILLECGSYKDSIGRSLQLLELFWPEMELIIPSMQA